MPYHFDTTLPTTEEELVDLVMAARRDGIKQGRQEGAREIIDRVDDWVRNKYYNREVVRNSPLAEGILEIAAELVHSLLHGDLGKIPELEVRRKPKRQKNMEV